jgi:uncharacterized Zn finger protein
LDWQRYFRRHILDRGYDYYCNDAVADMIKVKDVLTAVVSGTDDYDVEIVFEGDRIADMNCSCPYAEDSNYCKHMAAVLFEYEELGESAIRANCGETGAPNLSTTNSSKLNDIIADMGEETLRKELLAILENDRDLSAGFLLRYNKSDESISQYIRNKCKNADNILRQSTDRHGFVDWRNASSYVNRLIGEVVFELRDFVFDEEEARTAFDVSMYVYELFANTDIDDSGGQTQELTEACIEIWEEIVSNAENRELLEYILEKLTETCKKIGYGE